MQMTKIFHAKDFSMIKVLNGVYISSFHRFSFQARKNICFRMVTLDYAYFIHGM